ncbi:hypothetical protein O181_121355 [Austropuccinia psidii MF-1]|uniref:Uncharacterized protein n=1 Tax=Austropuccinia psidii MF-1 TaxID=1389203 RepID=A0A9Q3KHF5_9BASI|nr:hypothetical protein [Austropuccinia psidii MF-1]
MFAWVSPTAGHFLHVLTRPAQVVPPGLQPKICLGVWPLSPEFCTHQGKSRVNRWQSTPRCTARQDNVNCHMCHMRISLKAQTHFNTNHNVWVISTHWLPHPHLILPDALHAYEPTPPSR